MYQKAKPLKDPASFPKGYEYALYLLSIRQYSTKEVQDKMKKRGYQPEVIDKVIAELLKLKYLNDKNMAYLMLESFKSHRTYGYYGIKQKMMLKKIPQNQIESALAELSIEDEQEIAKRYLDKEARLVNKSIDPKIRKQKLALKLKARGFRVDVIQKTLN